MLFFFKFLMLKKFALKILDTGIPEIGVGSEKFRFQSQTNSETNHSGTICPEIIEYPARLIKIS